MKKLSQVIQKAVWGIKGKYNDQFVSYRPYFILFIPTEEII